MKLNAKAPRNPRMAMIAAVVTIASVAEPCAILTKEAIKKDNVKSNFVRSSFVMKMTTKEFDGFAHRGCQTFIGINIEDPEIMTEISNFTHPNSNAGVFC